MSYVNYLGQEIPLIDHGRPVKAKKDDSEGRHNGWRVQGIPPGALEEARAEYKRLAERNGLAGKPWDEENWLMKAKRKPVRKAFEIHAGAMDCKALAERLGWLRVEIVELKKEASVKPKFVHQ